MRTIYINGQVFTGDMPLQEAFVVEDGRFLLVGSSEQAREMMRPGDECVDLEGRFVMSGFIDSHMHMIGCGQSLLRARLDQHTGSIRELVEYFAEFARQNPPKQGGWIVGRGWNQDYFTDEHRMPDRHDLDKVSTKYPVAAVRCCGHCLVVNSKVIEMLGVTADTAAPEGGTIGVENGEPDGRFFDNAMDPIYQMIPDPGKEEIKDIIRAACRRLNACGITGCHTDDYSLPWRTVNEAYRELEESGELTVRVYEQSNFQDVDSLREFVEEGNVTGAGSDLFRIGPLKLLGDGALGARTAFLSQPYADEPDNYGLPVFTQETLTEMIGYAHAHGMQAAVHAIGDGCLDRVLNAYEQALKDQPRENHRHGIVHCQITRPDQLERMAKMKLHIYAQTIFIDYDSRIVRERVGDELAESSYNWKTLMNMGLTVSNGTDCPVELPDALRGIQCAVTRASLRGDTPTYLPEQAFTVEEALRSYSAMSAYGSFEEEKKGLIQSGMLADFVVLEENPFEVKPERIAEIPVYATYLGGKRVY